MRQPVVSPGQLDHLLDVGGGHPSFREPPLRLGELIDFQII
jgi:hypothetical protein